jgi:APA family basic amino acid/polyamine antiporter
MSENHTESTPAVFKKNLNLLDSTALVMGSMIGSGIFIVSADIARQLGAPGWLLVVWLLSGIMTIIAALSYGELAGMFPSAGGQYVYLREAFNPFIAFLYGWTLFMVIQTGTIAAVAMAFAKFTGFLIPWFSEKNILLNLGFLKINTTQLLAITSLIGLTFINTKGVKTGKIVQNVFTIAKIMALLLLLILGLFFVKNAQAVEINSKLFWTASSIINGNIVSLSGFALIVAIGTAMVGGLFSADAWNNITFTAGEVINPKRNIPLSLFLGTLIVICFYILANVVYLQVLPINGSPNGVSVFERGIQFATNDRVGTAAMSGIFGDSAALIMALLIMVSTFGCNNGLILAGARVYYAMAKDGLFFRKVGNLNEKGVPSKGLIIQCVWASLLCLSGSYSNLLDYVVFAVLIFYVLTIVGIFILRKSRPDIERPYKAFGYPIIPAIYIILATAVMIILLLYKPAYTWPGLFIVILGIPVFYIWRRVNKSMA